MEYVIELQDGAMLSQSFTAEEVAHGLALSNYFMRCGSAAISSVSCHVVMLLDDAGGEVRKETFNHNGGGTNET